MPHIFYTFYFYALRDGQLNIITVYAVLYMQHGMICSLLHCMLGLKSD